MYIALSIVGLILLFFLTVIIIGWLSSKSYHGRIQARIPAPAADLFKVLKDIESLPMRRKEVEKIEMLVPTEDGRIRWREIASMGGFAEFETLEEKQDELIEVKMVRSSFGISGRWRYELKEENGETQVTIEEHSRCEKLLIRSLMILAGRKATLRQEIRNLRKALSA